MAEDSKNPFLHDPLASLRDKIAQSNSQREFAQTAGVQAVQLSMVLNGRKALTVPMIRGLHITYGIPLPVLLSPTPHELSRLAIRSKGKGKLRRKKR